MAICLMNLKPQTQYFVLSTTEMKEGTKETRHWVLFVKKAFSFCVFNEKQSIHVFGLVRANACLKTKKYSVSS